MKILFIITALCENIRAPLKDEMHGLRYLIEYLESMLTKFKQSNHNADVRQEPNKLPVGCFHLQSIRISLILSFNFSRLYIQTRHLKF